MAACRFEPLIYGWGVLQTALAYERLIMGEYARAARGDGKKGQVQEPLVALARQTQGEEPLIALARETGRLADPVIRQEIARAIAYKTLNGLNTARAKADRSPGAASPLMSLGKLAMSRLLHEDARVRTLILGAAGLLEGPDHPQAEDANFLSLNAYFTSIGGGTDQIQRNIIGERVLGPPKEPEVDRDIPFRQARELVTYFVGQGVGLIDSVKSAGQVVQDFKAAFLEALEDLQTFVGE